MPIEHFSPWDCNWPVQPPPDAEEPSAKDNQPDTNTERPSDSTHNTECPGCVIDVQAQTLGEDVPLVGTPYALHYRSDRLSSKLVGRIIGVPLTGETVPPSLQGIKLTISVAGQSHDWTFPPQPNLEHSFVWDGLDAYGRPVSGTVEAKVTMSFLYPLYYYSAGSGSARSFAIPIGEDSGVIAVRDDQQFISWRSWTVELTGGKGVVSDHAALGGWTLSPYHELDSGSGMIYLGNGRRQSVIDSSGWMIQAAAGGGDRWPIVDGEQAHEFDLLPVGIEIADDGTVYAGDDGYIYRVDLDGRLTLLAGSGSGDAACEGGNALELPLGIVYEVKLAPNGDLYFLDGGGTCLRKLTPGGEIMVVAGNDETATGGDEGPAADASFTYIDSLAMAADGSVYLTDGNRVRQISTDGIIHTIAGSEEAGYSGDGAAASNALLNQPQGLAVALDGSLYIADTSNACIRRIGSDGIITTVSGVCGSRGYSGEGEPATTSLLSWPWNIAFGSDGLLYISDSNNRRVMRVEQDGVLNTVAGDGSEGDSGKTGDGRYATAAQIDPQRLAASPDGAIYLTQPRTGLVRLTRNVDLSLVPSPDASRVYRFDQGRHVETLDALTGNSRLHFGFDDEERLLNVTTAGGGVTTIERDTDGKAQAIVAPDGQRTELHYDDSGYLNEIINPAGERRQFSYSDAGLLTSTTDPLGHIHQYTYDGVGRFTADRDPLGGGWMLDRTSHGPGSTTVKLTTAEGKSARFYTNTHSDGVISQITYGWDGIPTMTDRYADGYSATSFPDGTERDEMMGPDPRFGMAAPIPVATGVATPMDPWYDVYATRVVNGDYANDPFNFSELIETVETPFGVTRAVYSAAERKQTVTTPEGRETTTILDDQSRPLDVVYPGGGSVYYRYDTRGRLVSMEARDGDVGRITSFSYDEAGNLAAVEDPLGRRTEIEYDLAGRPVRRHFPDGRVVSYAYDAAGNLLALTTPNGDAHRFTYEERDLEAGYVPPELEEGQDPATHYRYNLDKDLMEVNRPDGRQISIEYDDSGHQAKVHRPEGTTSYVYDWYEGTLDEIVAPDGGSLHLGYDGSLPYYEVWTGEVEGGVLREYWPDYHLLRRLYIDDLGVPHDYNQDGQLVYAGNLDLYYEDETGRLSDTKIALITTHREYNGFGEPTAERVEVNTAPILETRYTRDPLGRITEKTESLDGPDRTEHYTYDIAGRLTEVERDGEVTRYTYDANGNRLSREGPDGVESGTYDVQDRLTAYGDTDYTYTANGELKSRTDGGGSTLYTYDTVGNLTSVTQSNDVVINYVIDGRNRRIGKKIDGVLVQGFLYKDQLNPVAELNENSNVVSYFIYADKTNVPGYMIKGGVQYRIISDQLGSPRLVIDADTGAVVQRMRYDEFGRVIEDTNPGFQPFGFAGGLYDRDTGLVRFGARDYDPETGRWTSKDPVRFDGGLNLYSYVLNNPINAIDSNGLQTTIVVNNNGFFGSHVGGFIGSNDASGLVDPGGHYMIDRRIETGISDPPVSLRDYIDYQRRDGNEIEVYVFDTTPAQEAQIDSRLINSRTGAGGFCATDFQNAISGVGPFSNISTTVFSTPAGLNRQLRNIR
ncbi:NHL domain-containing protein [Endothiovibrio diazotrophicus]